jgi:hypothetical protein
MEPTCLVRLDPKVTQAIRILPDPVRGSPRHRDET